MGNRRLHYSLGVLSELRHHRGLIQQMTKRDIASKYKNSVLGLLWVFGQPVLQMLLYGFVFQVVLRSKWGITFANGLDVPFGLVLYAGIMLHAIMADTLVRAPALILSNVSFVKKVVFPLDTLPLVNVLSALISMLMALLVLILATIFFSSDVHLALLLLPIPIILLATMTVGLGWLLSALGVFFRDLGQFTTVLASVLLFTAPICYPATMVPIEFRWLLAINPLTLPVECVQALLFVGVYDGWGWMAAYAVVALLIATLGYLVFHRLRPGFADAI